MIPYGPHLYYKNPGATAMNRFDLLPPELRAAYRDAAWNHPVPVGRPTPAAIAALDRHWLKKTYGPNHPNARKWT